MQPVIRIGQLDVEREFTGGQLAIGNQIVSMRNVSKDNDGAVIIGDRLIVSQVGEHLQYDDDILDNNSFDLENGFPFTQKR